MIIPFTFVLKSVHHSRLMYMGKMLCITFSGKPEHGRRAGEKIAENHKDFVSSH